MILSSKGLGLERHFDERNLRYRIEGVLEPEAMSIASDLAVSLTHGRTASSALKNEAADFLVNEKYHWRHAWVGDQGQRPSCTGHAAAKAWINGPITHKSPTKNDYDELAMDLYDYFQRVDQREGRNFSAGATMLAVGKGLKEIGLISEYRWGYTLAELIAAVLQGPVFLGIWQRSGMDDPDPKWGSVRYAGQYRGGHCIIATGIDLDDSMLRLDYAYGEDFGPNRGQVYMPLHDVANMIAEDGEVLIVRESATL